MMGKTKLVIVPCWLNLVMKELGLSPDDLANCEKLSGILSPRDLLIYKVLNFEPQKVIEKLMPGVKHGIVITHDFEGALDIPTLEERASMANVSLDTLIYGATNEAMVQEGFGVDVMLTELETLVISLTPSKRMTEEQRADTRTFAKKASEVLFNRWGLKALSGLSLFENYIDEVRVDPVFY